MSRVVEIISSDDWVPWACDRCHFGRLKVSYGLDDNTTLCGKCAGDYECRYDYWRETTHELRTLNGHSITIQEQILDYEYVMAGWYYLVLVKI